MQYSYMERVKSSIRAALRDNPLTFEEIVKKCHGAYPLSVWQALNEQNVYSHLVPLYSTNKEEMPHTLDTLEVEVDNSKMSLQHMRLKIIPFYQIGISHGNLVKN